MEATIMENGESNEKENGSYYNGEWRIKWKRKWKMKRKLGLLWCIDRDYTGAILG